MKFFKYTILLAAAATLSACGNDWLDVQPSTSIETETSIKSLQEVRSGVNGLYDIMQNAYAYSGRFIYYGDVTGDDMMAVSSTKRTGSYYRFNFTKDNAPTSFWEYPYSIIQNDNNVLAKIDNIPVADDDENEEMQSLKGEALCIRGMLYFELVKFYGYPYLKDNGVSLGVPIVLQNEDINFKPARNTVAECYDQIIKDLTEGIDLISGDFNKGHLNKWAALTLLSRVYLYKGDNEKALAAAKEAIDGAEGEGWELWSNADYPTAWASDADASHKGEVLFEIVNLTTDSPGKESLGYLNNKNGYKDECITTSFYNLLSEDPNDVRLKLLVFDKKKNAYVNKYQPQGDENIKDANIPVIRLSEAYLNAAEAAQKLGDNAQAIKYLNPIVQRADPDNTVEGTTITLDRVLTERRKELVGEGQRMFDVIRNGLTIHRVDATNKNLTTKHNTRYKDYDWNFYMIVLPIPKAERDANPNVAQNPEYDAD